MLLALLLCGEVSRLLDRRAPKLLAGRVHPFHQFCCTHWRAYCCHVLPRQGSCFPDSCDPSPFPSASHSISHAFNWLCIAGRTSRKRRPYP